MGILLLHKKTLHHLLFLLRRHHRALSLRPKAMYSISQPARKLLLQLKISGMRFIRVRERWERREGLNGEEEKDVGDKDGDGR